MDTLIRSTCRACGSSNKELVLDLGQQPIANTLPRTKDEVEQYYPLSVSVCTDCWLLQNDVDIPDELLFNDDYPFRSGGNPHLVKYFEEYAADVKKRYPEQSAGFVVEIGSNDGTLLRQFDGAKATQGIDPSESAVLEAVENGVQTICDAFDTRQGEFIAEEWGKADLIMANHVLAHVTDPLDFLKGIKTLLAPDGVAIIEFQYALDLLMRNQFDHFYHEHRSFFSTTSLKPLLDKAGLSLVDFELVSAQGGSMRCHIKHKQVYSVLREEYELEQIETYRSFSKRVGYISNALKRQIIGLKLQGKTIYAYGASAKGCVLINHCDIGELLTAAIDTTPHKQGRFMPGSKTPIIKRGDMPEPDVYLVTAWNYLPGILRSEQEFMNNGGQFLVPLPCPQLL